MPRLSVGIVGPLTGPRAAYGQWLRRASRDTSLTILWEDDAADPVVAVGAAQRLVAAGAGVVIGHFNSECARAAGAIYQAAGVPLLLPAATAPDLCLTVGAFRLCASESRQIAVIVKYLSLHIARIEEIWTDGSPYGNRLAMALRELTLPDTQPGTGPSICALMGSHVAVAKEIRRRAKAGAYYLVPDDCVVDEFHALLTGTGAITLCPHSTPDFGECVRLALTHVATAFAHHCAVDEYLDDHSDFEFRQYRHASYTLERCEYLTR